MYELNGKEYTLEQISLAARRSNLSIDDYITKYNIVEKSTNSDKKEVEVNAGDVSLEDFKKADETYQKGMSRFRLDPEEAAKKEQEFKTLADQYFIPKSQFKQVPIYLGMASTSSETFKTVGEKPFDGYDDYVNAAKSELADQNPSEEEVLSLAKKIFVKEKQDNFTSNAIREAARNNEFFSEEKTEYLGEFPKRKTPIISATGLGGPITPSSYDPTATDDKQAIFKKEMKDAAETRSKYLKNDIRILTDNVKVHDEAIKDINAQQKILSETKYTNQNDLNVAKYKWEKLQADKKAIASQAKEQYDKLLEQVTEYEDTELNLDALKRIYNKPATLIANTVATAAGIAAGVLEIPAWLAESTTIEGFGGGEMTLLGGPILSTVDKYITGPYAKAFKDVEQSIRDQVQKPISIEEVQSMADFGAWSADMVGNQLPVLATLYAFPNAGLNILAASAAGQKYSEMLDEEEKYGLDYNNLQMFMAPALVGLSEKYTEEITGGQIKQLKALFSKDASVLDAARKYVSNTLQAKSGLKDVLGESTSETLNQISNNLTDAIVLGKDVNPFEGATNAAVSGGFMSLAMNKAPMIGARLMSPFNDKSTRAKIMGNMAMMDLVAKEISDVEMNLEKAADPMAEKKKIKDLNDVLTKIVVGNNKILAKKFKEIDDLNYDGYGKERISRLLEIDVETQKIRSEQKRIYQDENLSDNIKKSLQEDLDVRVQKLYEEKEVIMKYAKEEIQKQNDPYADLDDNQLSQVITKEIQKAQSNLDKLGLKDKVLMKDFDSNEGLVEYLSSIGVPEDKINEIKKVKPNGMHFRFGGKNIILLDKAQMKNTKTVTTAQHEVLHALLYTSFTGDKDFQERSGRDLLNYVSGYINSNTELAKTEFGQRIQNYISLAKDPRSSYTINMALEEVFPLLSDAFSRKMISYNPNLLNKIGDYTRQSLQRKGLTKINFSEPSSILNFIIDYNKNYRDGNFGKAFRSLSTTKADGRTVVSPDNVDAVFNYDANLDKLNSKVDDLVGPRNADGSYQMTKKQWLSNGINKAYEAIILGDQIDALIAKGYTGPVYGRSMEVFIDDVKNGDGGLTEVLMRFDPEKNDSLIGWINKQLRFRKEDVARSYRENPIGVNITPEMSETLIVGEEQVDVVSEMTKERNRQDKLIDPSRNIPGSKTEFDAKIEKESLADLTFKTVPNLISESLSEQIGIPENKITKQVNLSDGEFSKVQDYIYKNADLLMKLLPEAKISESASIEFAGKSTGVPSSILKALYEKVDGQWQKRKDLTKKEFLEAFALNEDGTKIDEKIKGGRSSEAQRSKSLIDLFGKLSTNVLIRKKLQEEGASMTDINNIAAGKSTMMFDASYNGEFNKFLDRKTDATESKNVVKTLTELDEYINDVYSKKSFNEDEAIEKLSSVGLTKEQATDLHESIKRFAFNKNLQRSKGKLTQEYVNSLDYEQYNNEREIKDQLGLQGVDFIRKSEQLRAKAIESFIKPFLENALDNSVNAAEDIAFIFHNFVRADRTQQIDANGDMKYGHQKGTPSLFTNTTEFIDFLKTLKKGFIYKQEQKGISIWGIDRAKGKKYLIKTVKKSDLHFKNEFDARLGVEEFHNGNINKDQIINRYEFLNEQAISQIKSFLSIVDNIREESKSNTKGKDENLFDKEAVAMLALNLISGASNNVKYAYKLTDVIKNEDAKSKIQTKESREYYTLEKNKPEVLFSKMLGLYLTDKTFTLPDVMDVLKSFESKFVPTSKKDVPIEKVEKVELDDKGRKVKRIKIAPPQKPTLITEQEVQDKKLEDKLASILSSKIGRTTTGEILDFNKAERIARELKTKDVRKYYALNPEVSDFDTLLYALYRDGEQGKEDKEFFYQNIIRPYTEANLKLDSHRQTSAKKFKELFDKHKDVEKDLYKRSNFSKLYTNDDLIRIYLYSKAGHEIPGMENQSEIDAIIQFIDSQKRLKSFADGLSSIYPGTEKWIKPSDKWSFKSIKQEFAESTNEALREQVFAKFNDNVDKIFTQNNMNKILASLGDKYYKSLNNILYRMKTNEFRAGGLSKTEQALISYLRGGVANVMFFNTRSAALQLISLLNYIDLDENNPLETSKTLANQDQYWKDVTAIFNSDYMRERRGGLQSEIDSAELIAAGKKGGEVGWYKKLLQNGYVLTKFGDTGAISIGGALYLGTMRRKYNESFDKLPSQLDIDQKIVTDQKILNSLYSIQNVDGKKVYVKLDKQQNQETYKNLAEELSYIKFYEKTEESQQSARPDRISFEQQTTGGRLFLAFQNTPMQYNRIIAKSWDDIRKGRGDVAYNMSRIAYYSFFQNLIFTTLSNGALFSLYAGDDEEDKKELFDVIEKVVPSTAASMAATLLRGQGIKGSFAAAAISSSLVVYDMLVNDRFAREGKALAELLSASAPIGIKAKAFNSLVYNLGFSDKKGWELEQEMWNEAFRQDNVLDGVHVFMQNPALDLISYASALGNFPLHRLISKAQNLSFAMQAQNHLWQNALLALGWKNYNLGIEEKNLEEIKQYISNQKKRKKKSRSIKR